MGFTSFAFIFLTLISILLCLTTPQASAQTVHADVQHLNLTGLLDKNGQFTTFIRLLTDTRIADQIENQLQHTDQGFTVFAPTDNAFMKLPAGSLNGLSIQQQVQLLLYHVSPKYYTLSDLLTVSNPLRTQATGQDGGVFGLNFTGHDNQVNVTTGAVTTQINNAMREQFPLALYQVDEVLLPAELFGAKSPSSSPSPSPSPSLTLAPALKLAVGKPTIGGSSGSTKSSALSVENDTSDATARNVGVGFIIGLGFIRMAILSL